MTVVSINLKLGSLLNPIAGERGGYVSDYKPQLSSELGLREINDLSTNQ